MSSYLLETVTKAHQNEVLSFLETNFMKQESLSKASGMTRKAFTPCAEAVFNRCVVTPTSFLFRDTKSEDIAGLVLSSVWLKPDQNAPPHKKDFEFNVDPSDENDIKTDTVGVILNNIHDKFFKLKPDLDCVLHLEMISVSPLHTRKGLASGLYDVTENLVKEKKLGLQAIAMEASSKANQTLSKKRNYELIAEEILSDYQDDQGKQILVCDDGTTSVHLMIKEF